MSAPAPARNHEDYEALAVAWAINALEPADQAAFEAHRDGCDRCELTVVATLEIAAELAYGVPDIAPPPQLRSRVLALAIRRGQPLPPVRARSPEASFDRDAGQRSADQDTSTRDGPAVTGDADITTQYVDTGPAGRPSADSRDAPGRDAGARDIPGRDAHSPDAHSPDPHSPDPHSPDPHSPDPHSPDPHSPDPHNPDPHSPDPHSPDADGRNDGTREGTAGPGRHSADPGGHRNLAPREARRPGRHGRGATRAPGPLRRRRRLVSALVAAVLIAGSVITTWEVARSGPTSASDRVAALSTGSGTVATVVAHRSGADVVTDALPPNTGRGTAYYLWGVPGGGAGAPQVVGTFTVTTTGLHSYPVQLTRPLDGYPVLAISEEKAASTPTAPSSVLGKGALGTG